MPTDLSVALMSDYAEALPQARIASQTDVGPGKLRRRTTRAPRPLSISTILVDADRARLETFWTHDTAGGTLPFFMPAYRRNGQQMLTDDDAVAQTEDGVDILIAAWWLVRFGSSPPSIKPVSNQRWRVSMQLTVMP